MEPLVLKKSCDACTNSKVKCGGGLPCERCVQKGIQCYFSPRKRRNKPKKVKADGMNDTGRGMNAFDPATPLGSLVEWERRSWSVFFTLYKHYGTSCSLHWFNRQLNKMRNYLSRQGNKESLRRLTSWMTALNIDVDALAAEVEKCNVKCSELVNRLTLRVDGQVADDAKITARLQETSDRIPFLKFISEFPNGQRRDEDEQVSITCNNAFTSIFGIEQRALEEQLRWTGGGFLPWGGDILARLLTKEKDVLAFVQILAIKFNTLAKPKEFPCIRDIPSCHMFEVNIKEKVVSGKLIPVNALIKCMHREIISNEKVALEISMEFTPLAAHEHLLTTGPKLEQKLLAKEECSQLVGSRDIEPFAVRKRSFTNILENPEADMSLADTKEGLIASQPPLPVPSLEDNFGSFDVSSLDDFLAPSDFPMAANLENQDSITSSITSPTGDYIEEKHDVEHQRGRMNQPVYQPHFGREDFFPQMPPANPKKDATAEDIFDEQANWLDGLLDWANKQDLVIN